MVRLTARWPRLGALVATVTGYLPKGRLLPEDVWRRRHHTLSLLLRAHVVGIFVFGLVRGYGVAHTAADTAPVVAFAALASTGARNRKFSSAMVALGLVTSSAVLVHLSGATIEMHFHFFVMVGILTLYQDWLPFLLAIGFVVLHHGVLGTLDPQAVYNHPAAIAHPFRWALIHGGFVLAASVASVVAWRMNEEQALRDSLTKLPNRTLFKDRVGHALARAQRRPGRLAVLFVDLDDFKNVNDTLGHSAGDQLLVTVAERVRASIRAADSPARLGGDEFAVLVEDLTSEDDAVVVARRILNALEVPFHVRGKELTVRASVGIALNEPDDGVEELLRNADVAMYTAKSTAKGSEELYEPRMHAVFRRRLELEADLERAVERAEFVLHYQPVIDLETGTVTGVEALVRWNHPTLGLLGPGEFIDVAEETGTIIAIGAWVLGEATDRGAQWKEIFGVERFSVSVNVSPKQLHQVGFVDAVREALGRSGLAPHDLILELTETVVMQDPDTTIGHLRALKALGVRLAIDDFGTGYSSLSYLQRLPVDILKIDKAFIDHIAEGETESAFARAILRLAGTLDLHTVAEGVETADQLSELRGLRCDFGQGYYFAKPLPADAVDAVAKLSTSGRGTPAHDGIGGESPDALAAPARRP